MPVLFKNHLSLAKKSIRRHRSRSVITCLGISIGIASITLILSLIGSIESLLSSRISSQGDSLIIVRPTSTISSLDQVIGELTRSSSALTTSLTLKDVESISTLDNIESIAPVALSIGTITAYDQTFESVPILATSDDFKSIENLSLSNGVFLSNNTPENSIILGRSLASEIFGNGEPITKTVSILGEKFIVLGILSDTDNPINYNNINLDHSAIVRASHLSTLNTTLNISQINIKVKETSLLDSTKDSIRSTLTSAKSGDQNFEVLSGAEITSPSGSLLVIVSTILGLIAIISLIVGGVGIMNIMLVTVTERTHEIGIKKAIGATNANILSEFVLESVLISIMGSFFGIIIGYILAAAISLISPFSIYITWQIIAITMGTGVLTGFLFGLIPAVKAAHKDPIRSLKSYY